MPCAKLWGGPVRDYVRTYCHLGGGKMEDFYETRSRRRQALRRPGPAGRGRWLHRVQVDGRAADDADRRAAADPRRRGVRRRDARGGRRHDRHHGRLPRPARRPRWACSSPRRSSRTVSTSSKSRAGRRASTAWPTINARRHHADRHRRARDEPRGVPRPVHRPGLRRLPARHHALRRLERSPAHRRPGRGLSHRPRAAQSAGAGQHGRVAGVRLLAAELHHLRNGPRRRALAAGRRAGRFHRRDARAASCGRTRGPAWASRSTRPR